MNISLHEAFRSLLIAENQRQKSKPPVECRLHPDTLDDLREELASSPKFVAPLRSFAQVLRGLNKSERVNFNSLDGVRLTKDSSVPVGEFRFCSV